MDKTKHYNIYDIARDLGISPSTVSKALNNNPKISEKTKEKVKSFIKEKGYTPNIAASSLKSKVSYTIGVAYPKSEMVVMAHYFFSNVIEGFRSYIEKEGYEFCYVSDRLGSYEVSAKEYVQKRNIDGVLILGATQYSQDMIDILEATNKVVSLDFISSKIPFVQTDDKIGAKEVSIYLKEKNFQNICYITAPYNLGEFKKRVKIFNDTINSVGLKINEIVEIEGTQFEDGFKGAIKLLEKTNPDCVLVSNDEIAFGVIRGFESKGYKVPSDVSVIGFDDMYFSNLYTPSLTTIHQDCHEIGMVAGRTLVNMLQNKEYEMENYIGCNLILRDSSK